MHRLAQIFAVCVIPQNGDGDDQTVSADDLHENDISRLGGDRKGEIAANKPDAHKKHLSSFVLSQLQSLVNYLKAGKST